MIEELEQKLDSFDPAERKESLLALCEKAGKGQIELPTPGTHVNLHCHTFFSYNTYGYSPSKFAWLARKAGLAVAGVVDFDVLDALEEFLDACKLLGLKGCAGLESSTNPVSRAFRITWEWAFRAPRWKASRRASCLAFAKPHRREIRI